MITAPLTCEIPEVTYSAGRGIQAAAVIEDARRVSRPELVAAL